MSSELLRARDITKRFPGVRALDHAQLTLRRGEIHALMGENGAGKSTLIKILTGVYQRDSGVIELDGNAIFPSSPRDAEAAGISTVYQEINLVPTLSVAENILLGRQPRWLGMIRWGLMRRQAQQALQRLSLDLDVTRELRTFSIAIQQMIAIARSLDIKAHLLILDEPTSSLDEDECQRLFQLLKALRQDGLAILFVTHFLEQVYAVTDRITVLRNGTFVSEDETAKLPRLELISKMLGREVADAAGRTPDDITVSHPSDPHSDPTVSSKTVPVIEASRLGKAGTLHPLDLRIHAGEVVGLAGLLGSGRTETARLLFGLDRRDTGVIRVNGQVAKMRSPVEAIRLGLAFCSEDRKTEGLIPHLSVRENLLLALQASRGPLRLLSAKEQLILVEHYVRALNIKTPGPETPIRNLSGGNQQKVLLARWLALKPKLILLDEPTRGIDVGAKAEIEKLILSLRAQGLAVLFISSELDEVVRVSNRVVVLRDRRKIGEIEGNIDEHGILDLIARHE